MKKCCVLVLSIFLWLPCVAQFINDGGNIDQQPYNFGFSLALNYGSFNVIKRSDYMEEFQYTNVNEETTTVPPLAAIKSIGKPGFSLGLLANLNLHRNFDLRFTPNIIFVDRDIEYIYQREEAGGQPGNNEPPADVLVPEDRRLNIRFTNLQYPLLLKFKSNRQGNVRAYVIGGAKFCMDVTSRKKYDEAMSNADEFPADAENSLFIDRNYFAWEAGIGMDLYYEFFKCSPELKISRSFGNVLNNDDNLYSRPLAGLFAELVQFTIHFE
ncbi:putative protein-translocating porin PorT [Anseongella ginsenosidimutans]|uniref:Outer membrane protein beta-barrel domain-containing protein n=1 Tax=Anseongella ginsenosidimutans TaxID=496056 RepID=A0A4R3KX14_9SPHI|nr:outer membrane beta-barrel protein [Anseongella ginsenosidimutans]QEC50992.1 PorT family protein [Anseongella ginsenosidimutans]TCS90357.1 putative protein-translocating porin PorT [Anseongella ginsenosidimutans]